MLNCSPQEYRDLLHRLREPFPPPHHKERKLRGGGKYWFVPWRRILQRINLMAPDAEIIYTDPQWNRDEKGDAWTVRCSITICGVRRDGIGTNRPELNEEGQIKGIGDPVEIAAAAAFRRAAEAFGICEYLRDQEAVNQMILDWQKQRRAATEAQQQAPKPAVAKPATNNSSVTYARR